MCTRDDGLRRVLNGGADGIGGGDAHAHEPTVHVAADPGINSEVLGKLVRQDEIDTGRREGPNSEEREEIKALRKDGGGQSEFQARSQLRNAPPLLSPMHETPMPGERPDVKFSAAACGEALLQRIARPVTCSHLIAGTKPACRRRSAPIGVVS